MPTSITVVETSTCSLAGRKGAHHAIFRVLLHPAVQQRDAILGEYVLCQRVGHFRRRSAGRLSPTPRSTVHHVRLPPIVELRSDEFVHLFATRFGSHDRLNRAAAGRHIADDGHVEIPVHVSASVRGIGVAVMTSTSGSNPFERKVARCTTPNRCCSSIIARPSDPEIDGALHQRMGADNEIDIAGWRAVRAHRGASIRSLHRSVARRETEISRGAFAG